MDSFDNQIITAIEKIWKTNDEEMLKGFLKPSQKNLIQTDTSWRAANAALDAAKLQAGKYIIPKFGIILHGSEWDRWCNYI